MEVLMEKTWVEFCKNQLEYLPIVKEWFCVSNNVNSDFVCNQDLERMDYLEDEWDDVFLEFLEDLNRV